MFSIETGCPPPELFVTVIMASGTFVSGSARTRSSASRSMSPLNGPGAERSPASAQGRSSAVAPTNSMLALVVSKWVLFGTTSSGRQTVVNRMRSAARPWWVGMTCSSPVMSRTASRKRKKLSLPA